MRSAEGSPEVPCAHCASVIPLSRVLPLRAEDFDRSVLKAEGPVLVTFSADWCAPCKWLDPYLDEIVGSAGGGLLAFKVDVDEAEDLATTYGIASVPTVLLFRSGAETDRSLGIEPERLREMAGDGG